MMCRQRGVALILVLVIVAMAAVLATAHLTRQQQAISRAAYQLFTDQGYFYALAAEEWAMVVLERDFKENPVDSLDEGWAFELPFINVEGGVLSGRLVDAQARWNVNNLLADGKVDNVERARFQAMLDSLRLPGGLVEAAIDWLDADQDASGYSGAEDDYYTRQQPAYLTANTALRSPSEMRLWRGMTDETYTSLEPLVAALPAGTTLNVNTATVEVLRAIGIPDGVADGIVSGRSSDAYQSVADFLTRSGLGSGDFDPRGLGVGSEYFVLESAVIIGETAYAQASLIHRGENGRCRVVERRRIPYFVNGNEDDASVEQDQVTQEADR